MGNIIIGDDVQTQTAIDNRALLHNLHLLTIQPTKKTITKEACLTIFNITGECLEKISSEDPNSSKIGKEYVLKPTSDHGHVINAGGIFEYVAHMQHNERFEGPCSLVRLAKGLSTQTLIRKMILHQMVSNQDSMEIEMNGQDTNIRDDYKNDQQLENFKIIFDYETTNAPIVKSPENYGKYAQYTPRFPAPFNVAPQTDSVP